jgi:hypothetical protein
VSFAVNRGESSPGRRSGCGSRPRRAACCASSN